MARKRGDQLFAGRIEDPSGNLQTIGDGQERIDNDPLIPQGRDLDKMGTVPRKAGNRELVVNNANGHAATPEAAKNSQSLIVAANHDGSRSGLRCNDA